MLSPPPALLKSVVSSVDIARLAKLLVERDEEVDPLVAAFNDRLLMRIFNSPSLLVNLVDSALRRENDSYVIELDFRRLPDDVIPQVKQLIGDGDIETIRFNDSLGQHIGFRVKFDQKRLERARERSKQDPHWHALAT